MIDRLGALPGVTSVDVDATADPFAVTLSFDPTTTTAESIVDAVAARLREKDDPLYRPDERPLEIRWQ